MEVQGQLGHQDPAVAMGSAGWQGHPESQGQQGHLDQQGHQGYRAQVGTVVHLASQDHPDPRVVLPSDRSTLSLETLC